MKIAILGYGREGRSVRKFLKHLPAGRQVRQYRDAEISILDKKNGSDYLKDLSGFDLVFRSPGVPYNLPEIQRAKKAGVEISSATKMFFEFCRAPIIGITGTKGKGTTATLIYKILRASGKRVLLAGNIGKSPLEILPKVTPKTWVVLELSSFQLWDLEKSPRIAVLTDIFPDHQDVHSGMAEYLAAKSNIVRHQKKSDTVFYFETNKLAAGLAKKSRGKKIAVIAPDMLEKNRILAAAVARQLGCPEKIVARTVKNYRGLEHRLEFVKLLDGIRFYDDSASTNPQTAAAAVTYFQEPLILIAGGKDKNLHYQPLGDAIKKSGLVRLVILMGENKEKIATAIRKSGAQIKMVSDLVAAVQLVRNRATASRVSVVVFSPGSASFDMFADYADRGKQFKKIVRGLE